MVMVGGGGCGAMSFSFQTKLDVGVGVMTIEIHILPNTCQLFYLMRNWKWNRLNIRKCTIIIFLANIPHIVTKCSPTIPAAVPRTRHVTYCHGPLFVHTWHRICTPTLIGVPHTKILVWLLATHLIALLRGHPWGGASIVGESGFVTVTLLGVN